MIRPLEYCVNKKHIDVSIDTIDSRIVELLALRNTYIEKGNALENELAEEQSPIRNLNGHYAVLAKKFKLPTEFIQSIFHEIENYVNQDFIAKGYEQQ
ncbi:MULTISPECIES: isochorismate pyruvate-lyase [unclassified Sphingobacterium]|uniref:isochorismate pyruvate-lyase n=1 Tax=unclassified Sphingobacterium TaxID=2609468 RepID=UPI0025FF8BE0|nr:MULTISPECIES: isochorismate pyruvate-lyase [unclassified Sphingobacterium]